mmetsp:Transcript_15769/g.24276  ORF Transcript_15769/g.24276 Transcript_15769/m.24276 type:complete len:81 (+) Transcript_15769:401-643(+)
MYGQTPLKEPHNTSGIPWWKFQTLVSAMMFGISVDASLYYKESTTIYESNNLSLFGVVFDDQNGIRVMQKPLAAFFAFSF